MQRTREKWRLALYLSMRVATSTKSLHLFSDSKQRTKLKTANSAGTLFRVLTLLHHGFVLVEARWGCGRDAGGAVAAAGGDLQAALSANPDAPCVLCL